MSASYNPKDGYVTLMLNPTNESVNYVQQALEYECNLFDMSIDFDIKEINKRLNDIKETKKIAFIKLLTFPIEFFWATILLPKKFRQGKKKEIGLWVQFLFNRIDFDIFNQERNKLLTKAIK